MQIINWLIAHWVEIGSALALIIGAARIIVKLTPTPKDDSLLETVVNALKHVGLQVKDEAKPGDSL